MRAERGERPVDDAPMSAAAGNGLVTFWAPTVVGAARRLVDGMLEWRLAGLPVATAAA